MHPSTCFGHFVADISKDDTPIIFVAHSIGGIVVQEACELSHCVTRSNPSNSVCALQIKVQRSIFRTA